MKQIRFTNPLTVGEYPHQFQVNDAHIASISFNAHKGYRDEGVANLSIVLGSSDGRWAKNVVCENEECLKLMEKVLELTLESAETVPAVTTEEAETSTPPKQVAQEILERMQGARQGDHLQLPAGTIGDIPAEDEEE